MDPNGARGFHIMSVLHECVMLQEAATGSDQCHTHTHALLHGWFGKTTALSHRADVPNLQGFVV